MSQFYPDLKKKTTFFIQISYLTPDTKKNSKIPSEEGQRIRYVISCQGLYFNAKILKIYNRF